MLASPVWCSEGDLFRRRETRAQNEARFANEAPLVFEAADSDAEQAIQDSSARRAAHAACNSPGGVIASAERYFPNVPL